MCESLVRLLQTLQDRFPYLQSLGLNVHFVLLDEIDFPIPKLPQLWGKLLMISRMKQLKAISIDYSFLSVLGGTGRYLTAFLPKSLLGLTIDIREGFTIPVSDGLRDIFGNRPPLLTRVVIRLARENWWKEDEIRRFVTDAKGVFDLGVAEGREGEAMLDSVRLRWKKLKRESWAHGCAETLRDGDGLDALKTAQLGI